MQDKSARRTARLRRRSLAAPLDMPLKHTAPLCVLAGTRSSPQANVAQSRSSSNSSRRTTRSVRNPYSREIWAEVVTPSGQRLTLPAYYADGGLFAVRARPDEVGAYRFGAVSETTLGIAQTDLVVSLVSPAEVENTARTRLPSILSDPKDPRQFIRSDGAPVHPGRGEPRLGPGREPRHASAITKRRFPRSRRRT